MVGIVKTFGSLRALGGVDFELRPGEIHALLGENGAGKTTLMNILYGLEHPDSGRILVEGREAHLRSAHDAIALGIGMVHQHFKLVPRLTVTENVILGEGERRSLLLPDLAEVGREIEELGSRYGLPIDASATVRDLSVGEQQRVEILRALHRGARILILDEPTATLTPVEAKQLMGKLRVLAAGGASIVIITHHLDEVMEAADRVTILRAGREVATVDAAATNPVELARMMVGREVGIVGGESAREERAAPVGDAILRLVGLSSGLERHAERHARTYHDVDLEVRPGEIICIAGVEGNGQTELEETLLGLRHAGTGRYLLGGADVTRATPADLLARGVGFVPSDRYRRGMIRELTIAQNLAYDRIDRAPFGSRWWVDFRAIAARGTELVRRFAVATPSAQAAAGTLSGGNAQKVVLARAFAEDPVLVIAAQPTRGLDVGAIEFVWDHLRSRRDAGAAILLITTDLEEVMALSDRCLVMYRGRLHPTPIDREEIGLAMGGAMRRRNGQAAGTAS